MTGCNHTNPTSNGKTWSIRNLYGDVQYPYVKGMMSVFRRFLRGPRMLRMGMCLAGITAENSSPGRPRTPSSLPLPFGHRLPYSSASRCSRICGRLQMQFTWWSVHLGLAYAWWYWRTFNSPVGWMPIWSLSSSGLLFPPRQTLHQLLPHFH